MRRDRLLAVLLSALVVTVCASIGLPVLAVPAGALALAAGIVAVTRVTPGVRIVVLALTAAGAAGIVAGAASGRMPRLEAVASVNQDLVAMLAAMTCVRLVIPAAAPAAGRLRGWPAVARTSVVVHLLGSVINMSAVTLAAHRVSRDGRLALPDALLLSRAYSAGAFWSPFWLASAATLTYLPGVDATPAVVAGASVALVALAVGTLDVAAMLGARRRDYRGYTLTPALLVVPLAMVALVMAGHAVSSGTPIPRLVTAAAVTVCVVGLLARRRLRDLARHATGAIASVRSEAALFAAAGVLTIGLSSAVASLGPIEIVARYDVAIAWCCVLATVVLALAGLHPIVTLALVAAVILPLDPQPSLFMTATLLGWGAATTVGPTSGLMMHLTSQFGVPLRPVLQRNAVFVAVVLTLAWPALVVVDAVG